MEAPYTVNGTTDETAYYFDDGGSIILGEPIIGTPRGVSYFSE